MASNTRTLDQNNYHNSLEDSKPQTIEQHPYHNNSKMTWYKTDLTTE